MRGRYRAGLLAFAALCAFTLGAIAPLRNVAAAGPAGGVVLDGYGGIHPFGGAAIDTRNAPYWPGWDIARSLVVLPDASGGWVLDGWGGVHAIGSAPPLYGAPYWPGWDIARALVALPNRAGGYVLDGWGGIHAFGAAPPLAGAPYWPGWDIARGLDVHLDGNGQPDGGWMLDAWGGVHTFGAAPSLPSSHYMPGLDIMRAIHVAGGGAYVVGRWGLVDRVGSPLGIDFSGQPSWGSWDIVRDLVPVNPSGPWNDQPLNRAAASALMSRIHSLDRNQRGSWGLAENGTLDAIAGGGFQYDVAGCGGPGVVISDRVTDMYERNYFAHVIPGCAGNQYVFSTYLPASGLPWRYAGENIAWLGGPTSLLDAAWQINTMWLNSPEHYANIMSSHFNQVGCGVYHATDGTFQGAGGSIWVWSCEFSG